MGSRRREIMASVATGLSVGLMILLVTGVVRLAVDGAFRPAWLYAASLTLAIGLVRYFARRSREGYGGKWVDLAGGRRNRRGGGSRSAGAVGATFTLWGGQCRWGRSTSAVAAAEHYENGHGTVARVGSTASVVRVGRLRGHGRIVGTRRASGMDRDGRRRNVVATGAVTLGTPTGPVVP